MKLTKAQIKKFILEEVQNVAAVSELEDVVRAVRQSIQSAVSDDPPADWRESLTDAAHALEGAFERLAPGPLEELNTIKIDK